MKNVLDVMSFGDFEYYKNLASDVAENAELSFGGWDEDEKIDYVHQALRDYYDEEIVDTLSDESEEYVDIVKSFFR